MSIFLNRFLLMAPAGDADSSGGSSAGDDGAPTPAELAASIERGDTMPEVVPGVLRAVDQGCHGLDVGWSCEPLGTGQRTMNSATRSSSARGRI